MQKTTSLLGIMCLSLLLAACAGTQNRHTDPENDPWEGFNRNMYAFNDGLDKVVRPIAVGYDKVMPDPFQRGVGNFFRNLDAPVTFVHQMLQKYPSCQRCTSKKKAQHVESGKRIRFWERSRVQFLCMQSDV